MSPLDPLPGAPVLTYHSLLESVPPGDRAAIARDVFGQHVALILKSGRTIADLEAWWEGRLSAPSTIITFDDGHSTDFEVAFPHLAEAKATATFFVNPALLGTPGRLTWAQVLEMQRAGHSVQSHSYAHVDLSRLSPPQLREQLRRSKEELESRLGTRVSFLAVPYGLVNRRIVDTALGEGYRAVCTSQAWPAQPGNSTISRFAIRPGTGPRELSALLAGRAWPYLLRGLGSAVAHFPRRLLLRFAPARLGVRVLERPKDSAPPLHVVVLVDALGWTYVEGTDFLSDWLPHRQPLRTVLGYSSGAIPTLLTGEPPARHGHWNLYYYDPDGSPFRWLRPFPLLARALDNRLGRRALSELGRRVLGLGPLFEVSVAPRLLPYFNWIEKKNIYAPGGISGAPSLFDRLLARDVRSKVYTYHRFKDQETLDRAPADIASGDADFYFLYLSEIDHILHHHCEEPAVVEEKLQWCASGLAKVFAAARKRDPAARLLLLSDHGMTPVKHRLPLVSQIEALDFKMPEDYLSLYDSTMARFWFYRDEARRAVIEHLESIPNGRILSDEELDRLGILFADRHYGEIVFLLDPGWVVSDSGFAGRGWTPAGMHGYDPEDRWSDGVLLADKTPEPPVESLQDARRLLEPED